MVKSLIASAKIINSISPDADKTENIAMNRWVKFHNGYIGKRKTIEVLKEASQKIDRQLHRRKTKTVIKINRDINYLLKRI